MALKTNWVDGDILTAGTVTSTSGLNGITTTINLTTVPIGGIIAWGKSITGCPTLSANFMECDGSTINDADSPMNGQEVPNLNAGGRFLYGATTSGGTKTEDFLPNHTHSYDSRGDTSGSAGQTTGATTTGTAWLGYAIVWVIRIK